jgi:outer membrane protein OmpA-like peptidoglycan-associated protein
MNIDSLMRFTSFFLKILFIGLFWGLVNNLMAQNLEQKSLNIYFDSDIDEVNNSSKKSIREVIIELGSASIREIYLVGHTDSVASDQYNENLSSRRAANTRRFLKDQGVKDRMIRMEFFGESKPTSELKSKNRRVELIFIFETSSPEIGSSPHRVLIITTYKAETTQRLTCTYILDLGKKHEYGKTNRHGVCTIQTDNSGKEVTFLKKGYLNESVELNGVFSKVKNDTAFVDVYLRPVVVLQKLRFENIFFYTDSDELKPTSKPELTALLKMLQQFPELYIEIQGHMNFAVSRHATSIHKRYNLDLSHRRAKAVHGYLVEHGIDKNRLTYKGLSNYQMIYPDPQTREQEDMNKRVEVWTLQVISETKKVN